MTMITQDLNKKLKSLQTKRNYRLKTMRATVQDVIEIGTEIESIRSQLRIIRKQTK